MTVSANDLRKSYTGNGVATSFSGPFAHLPTQIKVYVDGVLQVAGYTLSAVGGTTPTNILFTTAPGAGAAVVIERSVDYDQQLDVSNQGVVYPEQYERGFDAVVFQTQQLADRIGYAVRFPAGYAGGASLVLPVPPVGGQAIRWNAGGTALEYFTPIAGSVTSVAATGSTGLSVGGSPITSSGTLTFTLSANLQSWSSVSPSTKADASHTHGISDIDATGTPSGTTFLRGDGVWAVPAGGGGGGAWGSITGTLSAQTDLQTALDGKATSAQGAKADSALQPNAPITGSTKTKITYDADGLVTGGADATTADIADSTNKRYVTDAQLTVIGNTSGTNTGDQTSVTGNAGTATALQTARTIDGQSFNGTANITVIAPGTHAATSKATPVDADELPLVDSAASNVLKRLTWANLKATVKTYFDTLYAAITHTHSLSNLTQSSATTGQVAQWNGTAWVPATVSGGGSPGGSDKQLQYNNAGAFGGCSVAYWDAANGRLSIGAGGSPGAKLHVQAASASEVVAIGQAAASQTANIHEWRDSSGAAQAYISDSGRIRLVQQGSESAPALAFDIGGNVGYGMWYSVGAIRFSVNSTEVAQINSGGVTARNVMGDASHPGVIYGFMRQLFALSSSTTLTSGSYNGSTITNGTASAAITSTLISAAQGQNHRMVDTNATYRWTIKPNTGDTILWPDGTVVTAATGSIVSTAQYDTVDLEAIDATVWLARNVSGTWTVTP